MFDIAYHGQDQPGVAAQAKDIARRADIPLRYLEQIFQELKRAGLVESRRGPRGGYYLERDPSEITLGQVVRALQGPIDEQIMIAEDGPGAAREPRSARPRRAPSGSTRPVPDTNQITSALWRQLARHINDWFDSVTLADLVAQADELGVPRAGAGQPMYFI